MFQLLLVGEQTTAQLRLEHLLEEAVLKFPSDELETPNPVIHGYAAAGVEPIRGPLYGVMIWTGHFLLLFFLRHLPTPLAS